MVSAHVGKRFPRCSPFDLDEIEVSRACNALLADGHLERAGSTFVLPARDRERMESLAQEG